MQALSLYEVGTNTDKAEDSELLDTNFTTVWMIIFIIFQNAFKGHQIPPPYVRPLGLKNDDRNVWSLTNPFRNAAELRIKISDKNIKFYFDSFVKTIIVNTHKTLTNLISSLTSWLNF